MCSKRLECNPGKPLIAHKSGFTGTHLALIDILLLGSASSMLRERLQTE